MPSPPGRARTGRPWALPHVHHPARQGEKQMASTCVGASIAWAAKSVNEGVRGVVDVLCMYPPRQQRYSCACTAAWYRLIPLLAMAEATKPVMNRNTPFATTTSSAF